ncbi:SDR family NAD(P)-dependent oxidoreductase [Pseudonocardia eucalypti]|uniref:SDR family NAD(P)-dependent oxidoreductase n=1 Tax=Pseudonocardia eucalypti TaxID=648755 RepID=A0ABP9QEB0_9PSEU|nr:NAD(P)-dependent dehydrogenase (short-subunit alcohol dehydrogenase family) [Pseudonocardia eucalypti]
MDLGLKGRRALVTGGSKGIGRRIAETFADEGAHVSICARDAGDVNATVEALRGRGVRAFGQALDVADAEALTRWVERSAEELGGLDIAVANVSALAIPITPENWRMSYEVDLMHTVRMVDAAMPHLERSEVPSIVTVSSVSGREIDFTAGPYGTFKAALVHYTQGVAFQQAAKGIRANTVSPGNVFFEGGVWDNIERNNPELYAQALGLNPTGRMATPEEIARAVVFAASPAVPFMTGTNIVVDGALTRGVQL